MSGLSHTPGKRARGKTLRGFESRLLRQFPNDYIAEIDFTPQRTRLYFCAWKLGTSINLLRLHVLHHVVLVGI